ncbi:MAG: YajD family HNH nuclease [Thermodesulfobacteriota bacterium]
MGRRRKNTRGPVHTVEDVMRERESRLQTYRERALKMFPWICGRCGREFEGKRLRELTVHHKDHDHENNPPDGSNWELLCIYCHDMEHARYLDEDPDEGPEGSEGDRVSGYKPFASLGDLLKNKK